MFLTDLRALSLISRSVSGGRVTHRRLRAEGSFAALYGTSPVEASSGKHQRHRINQGGNHLANSALHIAVLIRARRCAETRACIERRTEEGKSEREICAASNERSPAASTASSSTISAHESPTHHPAELCHRVEVEHDQELEELEEAMWLPATRGDKSWMDQHLSDDFTEFGQSGRRYTRAEIIDADVGDFTAVLPLRDLVMRSLGTDHMIVTYQSEIEGARANRSSIWQRTPSGWLMRFHQGTPTTNATS